MSAPMTVSCLVVRRCLLREFTHFVIIVRHSRVEKHLAMSACLPLTEEGLTEQLLTALDRRDGEVDHEEQTTAQTHKSTETGK
jgi:hypothetical protein